jgi:tungstate transport system substrate-binding protein
MTRLCCALLTASLLGTGCSGRPSVTLATTTSTQDTGLLDVLVPRFRDEAGVDVKVVAVGTGQALALGLRGDADVLLVHDPEGEERFMEEGHGEQRRPVMHNDFVLVGPPADPAGVKGLPSASGAFGLISQRQQPFVSRGDESGTHKKEQALWRQAGVEPAGGWYVRAGAGMGEVLRMASEKRAYTLSDRGTFLALQKGLDLAVLAEGDPLLANPYHVIVVAAGKHAPARHEAARKFADFLTAPATQQLIGDFGKDRFGQPLFFPDAAAGRGSGGE